jgi:hypothetical protein
MEQQEQQNNWSSKATTDGNRQPKEQRRQPDSKNNEQQNNWNNQEQYGATGRRWNNLAIRQHNSATATAMEDNHNNTTISWKTNTITVNATQQPGQHEACNLTTIRKNSLKTTQQLRAAQTTKKQPDNTATHQPNSTLDNNLENTATQRHSRHGAG